MRGLTFTVLVALWSVCPTPFFDEPFYDRIPGKRPDRRNPYWQEPTRYPKRPFFPRPYIPNPTVEVYQEVEGREMVVLCRFRIRTGQSYFQLYINGTESSLVLSDPACTEEVVCIFKATVSPPVSFTCKHEVSSARSQYLSDVYTYHAQEPVYAPSESSVSPFYIGYACAIGVCLIVLVTIVVVTTLRTRHKGSCREAQQSIYENSEIPPKRHR